jgi:hypothetical protein
MLAARPLFAWMQVVAKYEPGKVIVSGDPHELVLRAGEKTALLDGKQVGLSTAPFEKEGCIYLPLRAVQLLGGKADETGPAEVTIEWKGRIARIWPACDERLALQRQARYGGTQTVYDSEMKRGQQLLASAKRTEAEKAFGRARSVARGEYLAASLELKMSLDSLAVDVKLLENPYPSARNALTQLVQRRRAEVGALARVVPFLETKVASAAQAESRCKIRTKPTTARAPARNGR